MTEWVNDGWVIVLEHSVANETFSLFILLPETEMAENVGLYLLVYLIVQILTTIANKPFLK